MVVKKINMRPNPIYLKDDWAASKTMNFYFIGRLD